MIENELQLVYIEFSEFNSGSNPSFVNMDR